MNARTKPQTRFFAALIAATLFAVAAGMPRTPADTAQGAGIAAQPATIANAAAPAKPQTIATTVVLPQIVVRPTDAERAAALADTPVVDNSPFVRPGDSSASTGAAIASSPRMNFDMPYYAFGKVRSASPK